MNEIRQPNEHSSNSTKKFPSDKRLDKIVKNESNEYRKDDRRFSDERLQLEEKSLESTKITLGLVCESEQIGIKTGHELVAQREQLNKVEVKLQTMNNTLQETQKHLTSMKGFFTGLKTYFSKKTDNVSDNKSTSAKSLNSSDDNFLKQIETFEKSNINSYSHSSEKTGKSWVSTDEEFQDNNSYYSSRSQQIDDELEKNLGEIDLGVGRLKQLSLSLGNEIDLQNSSLDRITKEAEKAEMTVKHQNSQMRAILRKA